MEIKELSTNTWSELGPQYAPDSDVLSNQQKIHFDSCMSFAFSNVLKGAYDQKNNNYTTFALTSATDISDNFTIDTPEQAGNGFVTTLGIGVDAIFNTSRRYCRILPAPQQNYLDIGSNYFFGERNPDFYFEIDFLKNNTCRISHNYYNIKYYLNYNFLNNKVIFLSGSNDINTENTIYKQQFEYIYDKDQKLMSFFYRKNNNVYILTQSLTSLSFAPLTGSNIEYSHENVFHVNPVKFNLLTSLSSFWFEYTKEFNTNNLNVDCSVKETDNNQLIFHSEFNTINSSQIPFNILGQKNSLTPFSKNVSSADTKKQRKYVSLNTGSRQETGNIKFSTNYSNEYAEYVFPSERITYFHSPVNMGNYELININDTDLVESGAIYHNTPEFSDKVWKKLSNYKLTSKFGDPKGEVNGTWLCSWLSGSSNPDAQPVWYDRYFVPNTSSKEQAFSASNVYTYESHYDCVTTQASQPVEIFDVRSNLTFDPYTLYAYYRTGKKDILNLINQNKNNLLFQQINQYLDVNGTVLAQDDSGNYTFLGSQYGSCDTINSKNFNNQFSLFFSIFSEDYSKPFGHELIGNYKNRGLGIYSDRSVSPFVRIINGKDVLIYDAKMNLLDTVTFQKPLIQIVQLESLDDYFVLDNSGELFQLDSKNTIFDSNLYGPLSSTISHFSDDIYTHFLVSVSGDVVSYNRKSENMSYNSFPRNFSVSPMSAAGDLKRVGDSLYVIDGKQAQIYEPSRIFYLKKGEIYEWNLYADINETRFFNSSGAIVTYKIDEKNNFYIFDDNSTCHVHNSAGFVVTDLILPISSSKIIYSDYGKMYSNGKKMETIYAICSSANSNLLVSINPKNLSVFGTTIYSLNHSLTGGKISGITNSNYNKEILNVQYPDHTFSVRIGLPNIYAYNDFDEINLKFDARQLVYGYHEIALSFDSVKGNAFLIIDGKIADSKSFTPAKYSFSEIINEPLSFGSTQFFAGIELFEKIKNIENSFLVSNIKMRDIFFFTKAFNYYEIRAIQRLSKDIKDINFILPSESRNYTDTAQQFFRQRIPYHKSQFVDISINNSQITDESARDYIQQQLNLILRDNLPYYTKINKLIWRENV